MRDDQWHEIPDILSEQPQLLLQPNARGWNALHVAASSRPCGYWWKWLLQQVAVTAGTQSKGNEMMAANDMGQTVLDLYFRYSLYPLPWQRHSLQRKANHLQRAMQRILSEEGEGDHTATVMEQIRQELFPKGNADVCSREKNELEGNGDNDFDRVVSFWKNLLLLLETIYNTGTRRIRRTEQEKNSLFDDCKVAQLPILQILAAAHWCPSLVAHFVVRLVPEQARQAPLPLHIWCQTPKIENPTTTTTSTGTSCRPETTPRRRSISQTEDESSSLRLSSNLLFSRASSSSRLIPDSGMLKALCEAYAEAASMAIADESFEEEYDGPSLLPLAVAVARGKPWTELVPLFEAYPSALHGRMISGLHNNNAAHLQSRRKPREPLPLFCFPALHTISLHQAEWAAKRQDPQRLSIWCYLSKGDKERAIQQAREQLERVQLETTLELLRRNPAAIGI